MPFASLACKVVNRPFSAGKGRNINRRGNQRGHQEEAHAFGMYSLSIRTSDFRPKLNVLSLFEDLSLKFNF